MKINKKGQALIEFIIILPIVIFMLFALIDFGLVSYNKTKLENIIQDVGNMYKNKESKEEINKYINDNDKNITVNFKDEGKYFKVILSKDYNFITPGLSNIIKDYKIDIERTMYNG